MNKWLIGISILIVLAGFSGMNEWIQSHAPYLWLVLVVAGAGTILVGCFWGKLLSLGKMKRGKSEPLETEVTSFLSIEVKQLVVDAKQQKVVVTFLVSNKSLYNILPTEFMGSAKLDASTVSDDLRLTTLISSYCFKQYDTKVVARFAIRPEILSELKNKELQHQKAYWAFDLVWNLTFPSGLQPPWKPTDIRFEQIPRIGNV